MGNRPADGSPEETLHEVLTVSRRGQITLPAGMRLHLGIAPGGAVIVEECEGELRLKPAGAGSGSLQRCSNRSMGSQRCAFNRRTPGHPSAPALAPSGHLYLSVLTLGEIRRGVEKLQQGGAATDAAHLAGAGVADLLCRPCAADRWGCGPSLGTTDGEAGKASASNRQLAGGHCTGAQPGADQPQSQGCGGLACGRGQSLGSAQLAQTSGGERYLHWDELRHRPAPQGLSHEQWWLKDGKRDFFRVPADIPARLQD